MYTHLKHHKQQIRFVDGALISILIIQLEVGFLRSAIGGEL